MPQILEPTLLVPCPWTLLVCLFRHAMAGNLALFIGLVFYFLLGGVCVFNSDFLSGSRLILDLTVYSDRFSLLSSLFSSFELSLRLLWGGRM